MKLTLTILLLAVMSLGCASKKFVSQTVDASESRTQVQIEDMKKQVEETQTKIHDLASELDLKIEDVKESTDNINRMTKQNSDMIQQLGQLSFQKTLSESEANFSIDKAELTDAAKAELDKFAELLLRQNKLVHIEIQGHTDSTGNDEYNLKLGEKRASAVREYLYKNHDIPLHLMNMISFGATNPIADNGNKEGRAKNRRVVLVVRMQM